MVGRLAVAIDTQGEALDDTGLRFMLRQGLHLSTLYIDRRNEDSFEWAELENTQEAALEYLTYALGRHIRSQPVATWEPIPIHDIEELLAWHPPDQAPEGKSD